MWGVIGFVLALGFIIAVGVVLVDWVKRGQPW